MFMHQDQFNTILEKLDKKKPVEVRDLCVCVCVCEYQRASKYRIFWTWIQVIFDNLPYGIFFSRWDMSLYVNYSESLLWISKTVMYGLILDMESKTHWLILINYFG